MGRPYMFNMREDILSLLSGQKTETVPAFSGLIHITQEGLKSEGLSLQEIHHDPKKMARAAASTFKLTGMPSATLPLDLCSPAEALGAELIFYGEDDPQFPQVKKLLFQSSREIVENRGIENKGRIELICKAIQLMKKDTGDNAVISGLIPGPYTLLIYICKVQNLFREMKNEPQMVVGALFHLSTFLSDIANAYLEAGADFITIHDMGGSAGFVGPSVFEQFVFPAEKDLISKIKKPTVLSLCGKMDKSLQLLTQSGANAISIDHTTDLKAAREALEDTLLFGNIDPVETLWKGTEADVTESVRAAKEPGVDAVWPGCDLAIQTPIENIELML